MYRERGSKGKMERSSTATSSRGGALTVNGKEPLITTKDRSLPAANNKTVGSSRSSFPNKKIPSKGLISSNFCFFISFF